MSVFGKIEEELENKIFELREYHKLAIKENKKLTNLLKIYEELEKAATHFNWKVDNTKAHSIESYNQFKKALERIEIAKKI